MNLRVPKLGVVGLVAFLASAAAIFLYLSDRFGGPSLSLSEPYEVSAPVPDTQGLAEKSDVLVRGVKVGEIRRIDTDGRGAPTVVFAVQERYVPLREGATVRVGQKTLLGEAYLDLEPGRRGAVGLPDGAVLPRASVIDAVELDEALEALDADGRRSLRGMLRTFARGARSPQTANRVGATLTGLAAVSRRLRRLGETLRGQEGDIAGLVQDSRTVLGELAGREAAINRLVSDGSATVAALASRDRALGAGLAELPRLLVTARATLAEARPLLGEARPLLAELERAAPRLDAALGDLQPVAASARALLAGLPALNRTAVPVMRRALPTARAARPAARRLDPALANLVTSARYLEPRKNTLTAWFTNTADLGMNGDDKGSWARFFIFTEHGSGFGTSGAFLNNAYTEPNDGLDPKPYEPGAYPRLRAALPD